MDAGQLVVSLASVVSGAVLIIGAWHTLPEFPSQGCTQTDRIFSALHGMAACDGEWDGIQTIGAVRLLRYAAVGKSNERVEEDTHRYSSEVTGGLVIRL